MADLLGQTLGPYTVTERLGRGGMADVYKAFHTGLSVHRAIKVIRSDLATGGDFRARFQKEAQAVAQLRHPNIVQVHDFGSQDDAYYMVMEFIDGLDLKKSMQSGRLGKSIAVAVDIVIKLADALAYAHSRGVIHRDVKPENVMLTADGTPILMDFGIARLLTGTRLTQTGSGMGTPAYMAPEQATGAESVGPPADIYALTIVLFELLTGQVPFSADTPIAVMMKAISDPLPMPRHLRADLSEELQSVVLKGSAKRPEDRYQNAADMRDELRALTTSALLTDAKSAPRSLATTITSSPAGAARTGRGRVRALAIGSVAVLGVVAGIGWWDARRAPVDVPVDVPTTRTLPAPERTPAIVEAADETSIAPSADTTDAPPETIAPADVEVGGATVAVATRAPPPVRTEATPLNVTAETSPPPAVTPDSLALLPADGMPTADATSAALSPTALPPARRRPANDREVLRGVTSQRDLLRLFGGPDIVTRNRTGDAVWVYQRSQTATEANTSSATNDKTARLGLFFDNFGAGVSGGTQKSTLSSQVTRQIRTITVTITFSADRTVADYQVESTHF